MPFLFQQLGLITFRVRLRECRDPDESRSDKKEQDSRRSALRQKMPIGRSMLESLLRRSSPEGYSRLTFQDLAKISFRSAKVSRCALANTRFSFIKDLLMRRFSALLFVTLLVCVIATFPREREVAGQQTVSQPAGQKAAPKEMNRNVIDWLGRAAGAVKGDLESKSKEYEEFRRDNVRSVIYDMDTLRQRLLETEQRQMDTREEIEEVAAQLELLRARDKRLAERSVELEVELKQLLVTQSRDESMRTEIEHLKEEYKVLMSKIKDANFIQAYGE